MADEKKRRFLLAIVSKDDGFSIPPDATAAFLDSHADSKVLRIPNNMEKITVLNNRLIDEAIEGDFDFLVFMHADVELNLNGLASHIQECEELYDVMGLCGCEKISISESPLNWFWGSRKYPDYRWGCVCHGELGNSVSFFSKNRPETRDHAVSCIDGLCIVLSKKAMASGLRFYEKLAFNCYDTQISLDAVMKHKLRLGCLVEPELRHFSVGRSINTEAFMQDEYHMRQYFGFEIPRGSRLELYINALKQKAAQAV